jgi:hypothetical protein
VPDGQGDTITVTPAARVWLDAIVRDRNSPQKRVWRARIVLLTADGIGTNAVTRAGGKDKTVVWRWHERSIHEGIAELTRDKTRPSWIPPLPAETVDRVVAVQHGRR